MSEICEKCGKPNNSSEPYRQFYSADHGRYVFHCSECIASINAVREQARKKEAMKQEILRLGGPRAYREFTSDLYDNKGLLSKCADYPKINLFLWGAAGVGKTHLATALIRVQKYYWTLKPQEISRMMSECVKDVEVEEERLVNMIDCPHLLIDDIGTEKVTEFLYSNLYQVIDGRYMQETGGLIITSNLSLDSLRARFGDDRLTSRIAGMCKIIEIEGVDRRLGK